MRPREWALLAVVALVLILLWRGNDARSKALDRANVAEAAIPALAAARDSALQQAAFLTERAEAADSLAAAVRDSADALVARTLTRTRLIRDTLHVLVSDTVALRLIDEQAVEFETALAAKDSVIAVQDAQINLWRASSEAKDEALARWAAVDEQRQIVNTELRAHIRSQNRMRWLERGATLAAVAAVVVLR